MDLMAEVCRAFVSRKRGGAGEAEHEREFTPAACATIVSRQRDGFRESCLATIHTRSWRRRRSRSITFRGTSLSGFIARLVPNSAVFIVVGDVRHDEILNRVESLFSAWQRGEDVVANFPAPPVRTRRTAYLVDRPGSAQSNIVVIAHSGITRTNPDYFPMLLMHTVLGANASSRLFMNLREDKGYTYGAYSNLDARRTAGTFRATAECARL